MSIVTRAGKTNPLTWTEMDGNFTYLNGKMISVLDYGAVGDGITDDTAAIQRADTAAGNGGIVWFASGKTYKWTGDLTPSLGTQWIGSGTEQFASKLKAANFTSRLLITNSCAVQNFYIEGSTVSTPFSGTGVQIGNTALVGQVRLSKVFVRYFQTNLRLGAALSTTIERCRFQEGRWGVDFNASGAATYSTTVTFIDCIIQQNERSGVTASNVPHVNIGIQFYGGAIQNNSSEAPATYPQFALPTTNSLVMDGTYFENSNAAVNIAADNINGASFRGLFMQSGTVGIQASAGFTDATITGCYFSALTSGNTLNITNGNNIFAFGNQKSSATVNVVTGTNCVDADTNPFAVRPTTQGAFTPTLIGTSVAGTQTYTNQSGSYNQVGNQLFFRGRVSISAKDGAMAGNVQIGGLPIVSVTDSQAFAIIQVVANNGVTFSAGYTQIVGEISSAGATVIDLQQIGSGVAELALPVTGIAAATTFRFSGVYTVAG